MTDHIYDAEDHVVLFAKDRLVRLYGHSVLMWSKKAWKSNVEHFIRNLSEAELKRIDLLYGDSQ